MKNIILRDGLSALIDDADFDRVSLGRWYAVRRGRKFYVAGRVGPRSAHRAGERQPIYLHRFILNAAPEFDVDHVDGDTLNNTRANLRQASSAENLWNTVRDRSRFRSAYRGVGWSSQAGKWRVTIEHLGRKKHIGFYGDEVEAARAYDAVCRELRGDFARLNFSEPPSPPVLDTEGR